MSLKELLEIQNLVRVNKIIELGESQRELYKRISNKDREVEGIMSAYYFHKREMEALIKYQRRKNE